MYSSRTVDATDPDLYIASTRPNCLDFTVTERGPFYARSQLFNLGRVYAQRTLERLIRIKRVQVPRGGIMFLTKPGPSMFLNGAEVGMNQIAVVGAGEEYTCRLSGATQWGAMSSRRRRHGRSLHDRRRLWQPPDKRRGRHHATARGVHAPPLAAQLHGPPCGSHP